MVPPEPRAVDRIVQEALGLPARERAEIVRRLAHRLDDLPAPRAPCETLQPLSPLATTPAAITDDETASVEPDDVDLAGSIASW
jgi:hypothetical protein